MLGTKSCSRMSGCDVTARPGPAGAEGHVPLLTLRRSPVVLGALNWDELVLPGAC